MCKALSSVIIWELIPCLRDRSEAIEKHNREKRDERETKPLTYDQFVRDLDTKDAFTTRMIEILVGVRSLLSPGQCWLYPFHAQRS